MSFDLHADPVDLTAALVDTFSVSGAEAEIAAAVQKALQEQASHLEVVRNGDAVLARTNLGRASRVVLAGHLDTVPENGNLPSRREGSGDDEVLHGLGTVDMKGGDAVFLHLAATLAEPKHDVTFIFYDNEEVEAGASCVAAPILGYLGDPVGAISISGPTMRIIGRQNEMIAAVKQTAEAISAKIGFLFFLAASKDRANAGK